jgi:hypothetical protein
MAKLSKQEWLEVRKLWESDPREGHQWLSDELSKKGHDIDRPTIAKAASRQGWAKKSHDEKVTNVTENVTENVTSDKKKSREKPVKTKSVSVQKSNEAHRDSDDFFESEEVEKLPRGRPTLFSESYVKQAENYCRLGATNDDLADFFGVNGSTIDNWMVAHPDFLGAIKRGRVLSDIHVVNSMYHAAKGYSHPETKVNVVDGEIVKTEITKYCPPNVTAAIFWLKNRQGEHWKDKQIIENTYKVDKGLIELLKTKMIETMNASRERQKKILIERGLIEPDENDIVIDAEEVVEE